MCTKIRKHISHVIFFEFANHLHTHSVMKHQHRNLKRKKKKKKNRVMSCISLHFYLPPWYMLIQTTSSQGTKGIWLEKRRRRRSRKCTFVEILSVEQSFIGHLKSILDRECKINDQRRSQDNFFFKSEIY